MELGRLRDLTVPRARTAGFQPQVFARYQRRQPGVNALLRTAFISGVSTRQVGPLTALILDAAVSASTVSRVTQSLGAEVARFHARPLEDRACALLLDEVRLLVKGVSLGARKRVVLCAYGLTTPAGRGAGGRRRPARWRAWRTTSRRSSRSSRVLRPTGGRSARRTPWSERSGRCAAGRGR